jgi:GAF domain-containing protein
MHAKGFASCLTDSQTDLLSWPYCIDESGDIAPPPNRWKVSRRNIAMVRTGKTIHHLRDFDDLIASGEVELVGMIPVDFIGVPLIHGDQVLGAMAIQSYTPGITYTEQDVQVLTFVAQHIATALARLRLIEETRQRIAELAIINNVQAALASKLDFQSIIDSIGNQLTEIFSEQNVGIGLLDKSRGMMKVPYLFENGRRIEAFEFPIGQQGLVSRMIQLRQPLVINSDFDQRAAEIGIIDVSGEPNPKSWLGVPILINNEVIGGFTLQNWQREHAYPDSTVHLMQTLAGSLGVALENARLFDETQHLLHETEHRTVELSESNRIQSALYQIADATASADMPSFYRRIHEILREMMNAENIIIQVFDETKGRVSYPYVVDTTGELEPTQPIPVSKIRKGLAMHVLQTDETLHVSRAQILEMVQRGEVESIGSDAEDWVGVPLRRGGRRLG